eukprot:GHVU01199442.1.p1 GENE.GHVU01199442.1~~GHVU01199442.1.p1  ORF type:complete len:273 (+),score=38.83 GHVU01199442.1:159-977(+)
MADEEEPTFNGNLAPSQTSACAEPVERRGVELRPEDYPALPSSTRAAPPAATSVAAKATSSSWRKPASMAKILIAAAKNAEGPTASGLSTKKIVTNKIVAGKRWRQGTYWGEVARTRNNDTWTEVPDGFGIFKYDEDDRDEYHGGAIFYGKFSNGMRHGWGWAEYRDSGKRYPGWRFGFHRDNLKHGLGKQRWYSDGVLREIEYVDWIWCTNKTKKNKTEKDRSSNSSNERDRITEKEMKYIDDKFRSVKRDIERLRARLPATPAVAAPTQI